MAGAGYKLFNTGDVLTAAQVNTYLQEQAVMRFANATARTTALSGVLAEGMMSYLDDTNSVEVYNGSAWVSVGSTGDITGVTAGTGISGGGTSGDVTITNSMATAIDAKGDLIAGTGADTFSRLAVGSNNTVLTADSSTATGLKWAAASGGGLVLIGTTTFTSSSAVNINDVFSSTYDNYRIVCNFTPSNDGDLNFRYRVSGADNTTSNYYYQGIDIAGTSSTPFRLGAQTNGRVAAAQANIENSFSADMFAPNLTRKKRTNSYAGRETNSSPGIVFLSTTFDATTSFTGFSLYNNNGTITGTISVYGYAK